jgi:O-antigen/teichoic acid export membrane protein
MFGILMGTSFISSIQSSYLQGLRRYKAFAFFNIMSGAYRLVFPTIAVILGFKVLGALGGMLMGVLVSFITAVFILKKNFTVFENMNLSDEYKRIMLFSIPVAFVQFGMMLLNNIDVILVKKYFDPDMSGYYAGVVTLGKIFLFGVGIVSTVMFPTISSLVARGMNYSRIFIKLLTLQVSLVLGGVLTFSAIPAILTRIFFGEKFINSAEYLPYFSVFIGLYILINFFILFFLAINKTFVFALLIPGLIIQYLMINARHTNLYEIITANTCAGIITLVLLIMFFIISNNARNKEV